MATTDSVVETKDSFCRICHAACPVEVDIENNRVVEIRGIKDDPLFEGYTLSLIHI